MGGKLNTLGIFFKELLPGINAEADNLLHFLLQMHIARIFFSFIDTS